MKVSNTENLEVSLTNEGFPNLADTYDAMTPVPRLAVYTPNASNEIPAAAAVTLSQSFKKASAPDPMMKEVINTMTTYTIKS